MVCQMVRRKQHSYHTHQRITAVFPHKDPSAQEDWQCCQLNSPHVWATGSVMSVDRNKNQRTGSQAHHPGNWTVERTIHYLPSSFSRKRNALRLTGAGKRSTDVPHGNRCLSGTKENKEVLKAPHHHMSRPDSSDVEIFLKSACCLFP